MYITIDIGGTKTRIALTESLLELPLNPIVFPTEQSFAFGISAIKEHVQKLAANRKITAAVCAVAGPFDANRERLVGAPNIPQWRNKPLKHELERVIGARVYLENDTALAGLGEAHYGAGCGYGIVMYMNVGTGVGGARIVNGVIDERRLGFEPGHQIISLFDVKNDGRGELEYLISGKYVKERTGVSPKDYSQDDPIWEDLAYKLAVGVHNSILHWSPDVVVLGGSMIAGEPRIQLNSVSRYLADLMEIFPEAPELKIADCGDSAGLWGGLALIRQKQGG